MRQTSDTVLLWPFMHYVWALNSPLPAGILDRQADAHHTGNGWYFPAFPGWSLWAGRFWRGGRLHHPCGRQQVMPSHRYQVSALITGSWCQKGTWPLQSRSALLRSLPRVVHARGTGGASLQPQRVCVRLGISATILRVIHSGQHTRPGSPCAGSGHSQPCCLHRGSAWAGAHIPLWRAGSVTQVRKGPPAIRRVCVYLWIRCVLSRACRNSLHLTRGGAVLNCERWLRKKWCLSFLPCWQAQHQWSSSQPVSFKSCKLWHMCSMPSSLYITCANSCNVLEVHMLRLEWFYTKMFANIDNTDMFKYLYRHHILYVVFDIKGYIRFASLNSSLSSSALLEG